MQRIVHVFVGAFGTREAALAYAEPFWEPEPGDDVDDETYAAWERRNPRWPLRDELGVRLDEDFIETIFGEGRDAYLAHVLVDATGLLAGADDTLVLVHPNAFDRGETLKSTPSLRYLGPRALGATAK